MKIFWRILGGKQKSARKRAMKRRAKKGHKEYLERKEEARKIVLEKLRFWQEYYLDNFQIKLEYKKVFIKNVKMRWGSCSSRKNLNFNYKVVFLEQDLQDYLIVHELCHLLEMNHSRSFWDLVSLAIPDWKVKKQSLKSWRFDRESDLVISSSENKRVGIS